MLKEDFNEYFISNMKKQLVFVFITEETEILLSYKILYTLINNIFFAKLLN